MFIKCIEITGFKSYRGKLVLEFDKHVNVIVGRNGSGKSNFFDAMRFVLGETFGSIRADSRADLLHEGVSDRMMSATVLIHFDNSSGRLPVDAETVVVGRTVGVKKDEYFLNGKSVKKGDVSNLLEAAGFSRSNPYYIVAQGKITTLSGMSDAARLELLKEVAGTHVYDERRKESMSILEESEGKRGATNDVLASIEARMAELEAESSQLSEFTRLDRSRRAAEYVLYSSELAKAAGEVDTLARSRVEDDAAAVELEQALETANARVASLEGEAASLEARVRAATAAKSDATAALPRLSQRRVRAEARRDAAVSRAAAASELRATLTRDLADLNARVKQEEAALADVHTPAAAAAQAVYDGVKRDLERARRRMDVLIDRSSRASRYKSKRERDAAVTGSIADVRAAVAAQERVVAALEGEIKAQGVRRDTAVASTTRLTSEVEATRARVKEVDTLVERAAAARAAAFTGKNDAYRDGAAADKATRDALEETAAAERALHATTPAAVRAGLETVRGLVASNAVTGVHGPLIDLFKPKHVRYNTAVDVIAGGALFNVVVDDDTVATNVIERLKSSKGGRVTLMPLSRLRDETIEYPVDENVRPLMQFLEYDATYTLAVKQLFARVLLCRDKDTAAKYARSHGLTCVTLEGDIVNNKGAVQGGYMDTSRLVAVARMYEARDRASSSAANKSACEAAALAAEQREAAARGEEAKLASEKARLRDTLARLVMDIDRSKADASDATRVADGKARDVASARASILGLQDQIRELEAELASDMRSGLTSEEERELETLTATCDKLNVSLRDAIKAAEAARARENAARSHIADNLARRVAETAAKLAREGGTSTGGADSVSTTAGVRGGSAGDEDLREVAQELATVTAAYKDAEAALVSAEEELAHANELLATARAALDNARSEASRIASQIAADSAQADKVAARTRDALRKKEECEAKLRDIGTVPSAEVDAFSGKRRKELLASLASINDSLSRFGSVNKKAVEQFASFAAERDTLLERAAELDRADDSIRDLIRLLDARKDEAIMRTFKGVAKHFKEVFKQLVPKGSAQLHMMTDMDGGNDAEMQEEEELPADEPAGAAAVQEQKEDDASDDEAEEEVEDDDDDSDDDGRAFSRKKKGKGKRVSAGSKRSSGGKGRKAAAAKASSTAGAATKRAAAAAAAAAAKAKGGDVRAPMERFRGVSITASFTDEGGVTAGEGGGVIMSALSGGQKALVALALIMAIQRVDPAPFYLLDEIDAALDATHRSTVAAIIAAQSRASENGAQFILTTFKPELASVGDRFMGVAQQSRISTVEPQTKAQTLAFIKALAAEEMRVGSAGALGTGPSGSAPISAASGARKMARMASSHTPAGDGLSVSDGTSIASGGSRGNLQPVHEGASESEAGGDEDDSDY